MPDVTPPEELESELDIVRRHAERIPAPLRGVLTQDRPIDRRPVVPIDPFRPAPREPLRHTWVRTIGELGDDPLDHQSVLAYASDYGLLRAALLPHGRTFLDRDVMGASLDHAIWFHRPFRIDDWLLYETESTIATGARAFTRGSFFTRGGALVASVAQEGVIRTGGKPDSREATDSRRATAARGEAAQEGGDGG